MSEFGEFHGSQAGDFVQSLLLERNLTGAQTIGGVGASGSGIVQPAKIIEATTPGGAAAHFNPATGFIHVHRNLVPFPLVKAPILGGPLNSSVIGAIPLQRPAPAFLRLYVHVRGVCPLVPWHDTDVIEWIEARSFTKPIGSHVWIRSAPIVPFGHMRIRALPEADANHGPSNGIDLGIGDPDFFGSQVNQVMANRVAQKGTAIPAGSFYLDRIVAMSVNAASGGVNVTLHWQQGFFGFSPFSQWYQSGQENGIVEFDPNNQPPNLAELLGQLLVPPPENAVNVDLIFPNDEGLNPPSLLHPFAPMMPFANPSLSNYVQAQFLGFLPEAGPREEEFIDLTPPRLLTEPAP